MNYSLNVPKLITDYLRPIFSKPKITAWLNALLYTVIQKHDDFLAFKTQMDAEVTITCQVNRLRQALRDKFADNTIEIIHPGDYLAKAYIYLSTEPSPHEFDFLESEDHEPAEYDFLDGEYQAEVDYIVRIPASLTSSYEAIYAFVSRYNFTSRTFSVEIV
jgi:hypothetical protein